MKLTCFHFPILYLKQRTFSFLEQKSRIKFSSLSLLVDTTRIATLLLRKNHKSSNINPHSFYIFLYLLFADQILAPLPGRERLFCSILKIVLCFLCVGEEPRSSLSREAKEVTKDTARGFICPRKNSCKSEFFRLKY